MITQTEGFYQGCAFASSKCKLLSTDREKNSTVANVISKSVNNHLENYSKLKIQQIYRQKKTLYQQE